jgi:hypothetical protein
MALPLPHQQLWPFKQRQTCHSKMQQAQGSCLLGHGSSTVSTGCPPRLLLQAAGQQQQQQPLQQRMPSTLPLTARSAALTQW